MDANFTKVLLRRAQLYEKKEEHFDKALEDFQLVLRKEPANKIAREAVFVRRLILLLRLFSLIRRLVVLASSSFDIGKKRKDEGGNVGQIEGTG